MKFCAWCRREIRGRLSTGTRAYCDTRCRQRAAAVRSALRSSVESAGGTVRAIPRGVSVGTVDSAATQRGR